MANIPAAENHEYIDIKQNTLHATENIQGDSNYFCNRKIINNNADIFRLCINDRTDDTKYLIDTGADVSVVPHSKNVRANIYSLPVPQLYAANGTKIQTFGVIRKQVNLGLRRDFTWNFIIAAVQQPILGVDFLFNFDLLVDVRNKMLIDEKTLLRRKCALSECTMVGIKTIDVNEPLASLLNEYKCITEMKQHADSGRKTNVYHYIETKGPPVFARPRRLDTEKFNAARKEFEYLMKLGICEPSNSNYASPLHMVRKKN